MAAPIMRLVQMSRATFRPHTASLLTKGAQAGPHFPNVVICRTISAEKARKNRLIFYKTIAKFAALFVFMGVTSPYWTQLKGHRFEPRRDKKRRKLAAESEAVERENSHRKETRMDSSNHSLLPSVKAAEVVEGHEGIGYIPPRSKRFNFIADAVEVAAPAVVYIEIQGRVPLRREQIPISNGSGFIVSADGLILTNAHVVANKMVRNQEVMVKLYDGRVVKGDVIAIDSVSDLAAVKVNTIDKLPTLRMGKSSKLRPGEWVIAMGSPLALSDTITAGIVSTVNRKSKELGLNKNIDYIQTDASINMGNSGGPLVNLDGEAIGINTMMVTAGISFAIPSDYALDFLEKVKKFQNEEKGDLEKGSSGMFGWLSGSKPSTAVDMSRGLKKGYIGITMLTLSPPILSDLRQRARDFPNVSHGVLVYRIVIGSPAQMAGIQAGDVITHIDSQPINTAEDVFKVVHATKPITVTIIRGQNTLKMEVTPVEAQ
ncbi:Serine protease HTRA2, mitochondrial [Holothuria leucospilota]|uniref:Serine protease HTRA2, mitochondrial n=1 Tax=Holothuria leucospilota TaxID=206669 RepID=A0A9Q1BG33_HOLLE|nr:Serine protease HTRA2, mitochondrial [Holothuria leucospilota]